MLKSYGRYSIHSQAGAWERGTSEDGGKVYKGVYSGVEGEMQNNPTFANVENKGPFPPGQWKITGIKQTLHGKNHKNVLILEPMKGTETYGRTLFRIHGGKNLRGGSNGCPIVNGASNRAYIYNSGDRIINVVP